LPAELAARYALDRPLPPAAQARLTAEIRDGHCGHLPAARVDSMVLAQRARDATLADSVVRANADGGVLIAGNGHVRADHGVPMYLAVRVPGAAIVAVAPLEVREGLTKPEDYAAQYGGALPFDFVWFTPRMDYKDPCAGFPAPPRA
ncbi:MAG TPA: ChaN family lipoprotein, partial [Methylomirabilota bacterium]|nr:ChaN family lipoprotein [Methylomirabilota bacterium]